MVTTTPISSRLSDVVIYAERRDSVYRLRYEILVMTTTTVQLAIRNKLIKSFSLDRPWPDSYTERGIRQKAQLMQNILRQDFGLHASIVEILS